MSELEQEQAEEGQEPDGAEVDAPPEEADEEPEADEQPAEEAPPAAQSEDEREIEALYTRLETKAKNYVKGMGDMIEGTGIPVALCEMCADAYPGIRWTEPRDQTHAALLSIVGAAGGQSPLLPDPDAEICERCGGYGANALPAHVPGNEMRGCKACNGAGWLERPPGGSQFQAPVPAATNGSTEALPGVPETDPSVVDLRSRGFTVIPPIPLGTVEEQH